MKSSNQIKLLVRIGMLGALSFVIMLIEFYIGFAEFLKMDFSDIIAVIGGITMGPLAAVYIELVKNILKAVIITRTGFVGEFANFVVGTAFVLPAMLVYYRKKTDKNLLIGFAVGIISMVVIACVANYFIFLPMWGVEDSQARINMITSALLPFNAVKAVIIAGLSFALHKALKPLYKFFV